MPQSENNGFLGSASLRAKELVGIEVRPVSVREARVLRDAILRPGLPSGASVYPGDDDPETLHLGAVIDSGVIAVATICREAPPGGMHEDGSGTWRLRGMATASQWRGRGLGERLAGECVEHARARGAKLVWCSARSGVVSFYERLGFEVRGEPFKLPQYSDQQYVEMRLVF